MKKMITVILVIFCTINCIACNESKDENNKQTMGDPTRYLLDEKFNTEDYLVDFDEQMGFAESKGGIVKKDSVYYMYSYNTGYLYYYDEVTDTSGKLCGRAECVHDDVDCNAYLGHTMNMQLYDGYIYWLDGGQLLYRCDLDGNNREMVRDFRVVGSYYFTMHRGYIYMREYRQEIRNGQNVNTLEIKQYELEKNDSEEKIIFRDESTLNTRYMVQFYGNTMYLVTDQYESTNDKEWERKIFAYQIGSGQWNTIVEETTPGWIRSMYVKNGKIYGIEQQLNAIKSQVSIRKVIYSLPEGDAEISEWTEFEPVKTKSTHILPGYTFMIETAPHTGEGVLYCQLIDEAGNMVKESDITGLQPMFLGADDTGVFICLAYTENTQDGPGWVYKVARIPYGANSSIEYLIEDVLVYEYE